MTHRNHVSDRDDLQSGRVITMRRRFIQSLGWGLMGLLSGSRVSRAQAPVPPPRNTPPLQSRRSRTGSSRSDKELPKTMADIQAFMQQTHADIEQQKLEHTKKQLGMNDMEWALVKPRFLAVQQLKDACEGRLDPRAIASFRARDRNSDSPTGNAVYDSRNQLQRLLADKTASIQTIKEKLTALRKAQEQARQKLVKARQDLRSLLTLRQEAYLVTTRILD